MCNYNSNPGRQARSKTSLFFNLKWTTTLIPAHLHTTAVAGVSKISAKGVIHVRPGTINGGGGGGGGGAVRFRPNTKSGGPVIVWHRAYSI